MIMTGIVVVQQSEEYNVGKFMTVIPVIELQKG